MKKNRNGTLAGFATAILLILSHSLVQAEPVRPTGTFTVVAVRMASDVASTAPDETTSRWPGNRTVTFDGTLKWIDGSRCSQWSLKVRKTAPVNISDPNLSDTQIGPKPDNEDARLNQPADLVCGSRRALDALVIVDRHLIVVPEPGGRWIWILEKQLDREQALAVEQALKSRGFDPGPIDGILDTKSREALGFYTETLGVPFRFAVPVIGENLLTRLTGR